MKIINEYIKELKEAGKTELEGEKVLALRYLSP